MHSFQLGALQLTSGSCVKTNLLQVDYLLGKQPPSVGDLVLLPENVALMASVAEYQAHAESLGEGPIQEHLAKLAKYYRCYLVAGSLPIKVEGESKVHTTSVAFGPDGSILSHYHKLHLFDVDVSDAVGRYRESDSFIPGTDLVTFELHGARVGMAVCFDLRFPYLFELLRREGCDILLLPAAFTAYTGKAHWEPLLRARAIENQCYVIAAGQGGHHSETRETWGHSCIIDPWGSLNDEIKKGQGICYGQFDPEFLQEIRTRMPLRTHTQLQMSWSK